MMRLFTKAFLSAGVVASSAAAGEKTAEDFLYGKGAFQYLSYHEVFDFYSALAEHFPQYVKIWSADEKFPHLRDFEGETPEDRQAFQEKMKEMTCGTAPVNIFGRQTEPQPNEKGQYPCESLLVQVTNFETLTPTTPEVLAIGEVHGNEKVGVSVVSEMVRQLVLSKAGDAAQLGADQLHQPAAAAKDLAYLVDHRSMWVMPMPNAFGYYHDVREDQGVDPNRDMPYLAANCMQSFAGRSLNELARTHLFRQMIEFHAGTRQLVYSWAGPNHVMGNDGKPGSLSPQVIENNDAGFNEKSSEAPDAHAYHGIARRMQLAAGKENTADAPYWYPLIAPHTDAIYWIRGGIQDWMYAGSFEPQAAKGHAPDPTHPIAVHCPGYPDAKLDYKKEVNMRCLSYLVETDDNKHIAESHFGTVAQLYDNTDNANGQLPRNMRLTLRVFEMADPAIRFNHDKNYLYGVGCENIDGGSVIDICDNDRELLSIPDDFTCEGLEIWQPGLEEPQGNTLDYTEELKNRIASNPECVVARASFDKAWVQQANPDPSLTPQSHAVLSRVSEKYEAATGAARISTTKTRYSVADGKIFENEENFAVFKAQQQHQSLQEQGAGDRYMHGKNPAAPMHEQHHEEHSDSEPSAVLHGDVFHPRHLAGNTGENDHALPASSQPVVGEPAAHFMNKQDSTSAPVVQQEHHQKQAASMKQADERKRSSLEQKDKVQQHWWRNVWNVLSFIIVCVCGFALYLHFRTGRNYTGAATGGVALGSDSKQAAANKHLGLVSKNDKHEHYGSVVTPDPERGDHDGGFSPKRGAGGGPGRATPTANSQGTSIS
ncbi:unnamed protein product [Amoebophrya sp. A120]|nr:unnamed protein product [Amoebophrya sp. A120]|eukprot:GSA120T00002004001.1